MKKISSIILSVLMIISMAAEPVLSADFSADRKEGIIATETELLGHSEKEADVKASSHCICGNCKTAAENGHTCESHVFTDVSSRAEIVKSLPGEYFLHLSADITDWNTVVTVKNGVTIHLCLQGHSIGTTGNSHFFHVENGGTLTICDCVGTGSVSGRGAEMTKTMFSISGSLDIYGGTYKDCTASASGILYVEGGTVRMYGGTIQNGTVRHADGYYMNGGNVYACHASTFKMYGGTIKGGVGNNGGNIGIGSDTVFYLYGGTIEGGNAKTNKSTDPTGVGGYGGNIFQLSGRFYMSGGTVKSGTAGGTYRSGNYALYGNKAKATVTGGEIAGQIYLREYADFSVSGNPVLYQESGSASYRGIYIYGPKTPMKRRIGTMDENGNKKEAHLQSGARIYITENADTVTLPSGMVFCDGNAADASYIECPSFQTSHQTIGVTGGTDNDGNTVSGLAPVSKTHCVCGGNCEAVLNGKAAAVHTCSNTAEWKPYNATEANTPGVHYMYLTKNLTSSLTIGKNGVTLYFCFNGYKIDRTTGHGRAVMVYDGSVDDFSDTHIYLCDCSAEKTGGCLNGYSTSQGGLITVTRGGNLTIFGGTISGGVSETYGGNIAMTGTSHFTMFGGTVTNGYAKSGAENLHIDSAASAEIYGGMFDGVNNDTDVKVTASVTVAAKKLPSVNVIGNISIYGGTFCSEYSNAFFVNTGSAVIRDAKFESKSEPAFYNQGTECMISGCEFKNENGYAYYALNMQTTSGYLTTRFSVSDSKFNGQTRFSGSGVVSAYFSVLPEDSEPESDFSATMELPEPYEGIYHYRIGEVVIIGISSVSDQSAESVAVLSGGGRYFIGDTVTLIAEPKDGFRFTVWQKWNGASWEDTGCVQNVYSFLAESDALYRAYYAAGDDLFTLNVLAPGFTYQLNGGTVLGPVSSLSTTAPLGTSVRLFYQDIPGARFRAWVNGAGHILSTSPEYSYTTNGSVSITALYNADEEATNTKVVYISDGGQVIAGYECFAEISDYQVPAGPFRFGKTFRNWDKTVDEINEAIRTGAPLIEVRGVYEIDEVEEGSCVYRIHFMAAENADTELYTLSNLTPVPGMDSREVKIRNASTLQITADTVSGKNFVCFGRFTDERFEVLSYGETLSAYANEGFDIYAVYSSVTAVKLPTTAITLAMTTPMGVTPEKYIGTFSTTRNIPEDYTLVDSGILYTNETWTADSGITTPSQVAAHLNLTETNLKFFNWAASAAGDKDVSTLNIKNLEADKMAYARGYLRVRLGTEIFTYYSDIAYGNAEKGFLIGHFGSDVSNVTGIQTEEGPVFLSKTGEKKTVGVTVLPDVSEAKSIFWKSSDPEIVSVTKGENGQATLEAIQEGAAHITVLVDGFSSEFDVWSGHQNHAIATTHEIRNAGASEVEWQPWTSKTSLPSASGNYYLTNDIVLQAMHSMSDHTVVTICLAGHKISSNGITTRMLSSYTGITLNICDCMGTGEIVADFASTESGAAIYTTGTLNMYGGTIKGGASYKNTKSACGGLVMIYRSTAKSEATFNMYGGVIEDGKAISMGANLYVAGSTYGIATFNMYGGEIRNGISKTNSDQKEVTSNGGNIAAVLADLHITGDSIVQGGQALDNYNPVVDSVTKHVRGKGGNIFVGAGATLLLDGSSTVSGGKATYGGGISLSVSDSAVTVSGDAVISGNQAYNGGGIWHYAGNLSVKDRAEITENISQGYTPEYEGGGIFHSGGTILLDGSVKISENQHYSTKTKATLKENNIYLSGSVKVNIGNLQSGAEIGLTRETASTQQPVYQAVMTAGATENDAEYLFADDSGKAEIVYDGAKEGYVLSEKAMYVGFGRANISPVDDRDGDGTPTPFMVPLAGYGNTSTRLSEYGAATNVARTIAYELETDCIAVKGADGEMVLLYSVDIISINEGIGWYNDVRNQLVAEYGESLGLKAENISFTATHTHSAIDSSSTNATKFTDTDGLQSDCKTNVQVRYKNVIEQGLLKAGRSAVSDLKKVSGVETGTVSTVSSTGKKLNFVRHYTLGGKIGSTSYPNVDLGVVGSNFNTTGTSFKVGSKTYTSYISGHTTEANHDMMLLRFNRESDIPVVICNYRAHMTYQSGSMSSGWGPEKKKWYSPDWCSPFRLKVESDMNCHCTFFQGDAGNISPNSSITSEEQITRSTKDITADQYTCAYNDFVKYGETLASYAVSGLKSATAMKNCYGDGNVSLKHVDYVGAYNSSYYGAELDDYTYQIAVDMNNYFNNTYNTSNYSTANLDAILKASGGLIHSTYDAAKKISRAQSTARVTTCQLKSIRIGDVGIITAPYEMFDTDGDIIRENGLAEGYKNVFVFGYSNGTMSYVPSQLGFTQGATNLMYAGTKTGTYITYEKDDAGVFHKVTRDYTMPNNGRMDIVGSYESDQCLFVPAVDKDGNAIYGTYPDGSPIYVGEYLAGYFSQLLEDVH